MATVNGSSGNDFIHVLGDGLTPPIGYADLPAATNGDDTITPGGGNDIIAAGDGDDTLVFQGNFTALDQVDGGAGDDTLLLDGDYSAGVTFASTTLVNVETIGLAAGHSYSFTTVDATVAAGVRVKFDGSALGATDALYVDASAETDGQLTLIGGAGNDTLIGGAGSDFLYAYQGGNDTVIGGAGDDVFVFIGTFTAADHVDGGPGNDTVYLHGDYSAGVTFTPATMTGIETINLDDMFDPHEDFRLTLNDATVAAGQTMTITGAFLNANDHMIIDGSAEQDGNLVFIGGAAADTLTGGAGNDMFTGGAGNDTITGGAGIDTAVFSGAFASYQITFQSVSQTFQVVDQRPGSPDGTDSAQVEQLKFTDATLALADAQGSTTLTMVDTTATRPWTTEVIQRDANGQMTQQTVNEDNGTRWVNYFDVASTGSWSWGTDHCDAAGHKISQNGTYDDGTHWLAMFDPGNQYAYTWVMLTYDAQWNRTGITELNDDGSHTVLGDAANAFDTAQWFATPFDPNFDPIPPLPPPGPSDFL